ncbi:hypothetical protein ACIHAA_18605 [Streptomyces sp. NPDC052040]|uniref:hypothetical protein n=1 Tax=unclassified Streptomyces TaxID=2593676 RepID=UPI0037D164C9
MMHGKPTQLAASAGTVTSPLLLTTAYRLWWVVMTLTLAAAVAAVCRLLLRRME